MKKRKEKKRRNKRKRKRPLPWRQWWWSQSFGGRLKRASRGHIFPHYVAPVAKSNRQPGLRHGQLETDAYVCEFI